MSAGFFEVPTTGILNVVNLPLALSILVSHYIYMKNSSPFISSCVLNYFIGCIVSHSSGEMDTRNTRKHHKNNTYTPHAIHAGGTQFCC